MKRDYPRPNLYRDNIMLLDGKWLLDTDEINVPYPPQSKLSGYSKDVPDRFTYSKEFRVDELVFDEGSRFILHFGAIDQIAKVYVNDILLGEHVGGYLSFQYDVTEAVNPDGVNRIVVEVTDELDVTYPYGKQCKKSHSMWYTCASGIWKSVFIEVVPREYISDIKTTITDIFTKISVDINSYIDNDKAYENETDKVTFNIYEGVILKPKEYDLYKYIQKERLIYSKEAEGEIVVDEDVISEYLNRPYELKLWDEYSPVLYPVEIIYKDDRIYSYIAFRNVCIMDMDNVPRLCINEKPAFLHGVLDQGYYIDGNLTPPDYMEYDRDILRMKKLGFNTLRKHIKIEAAQFYYSCDRLGMYVVQDMVNSGKYHYVRDTILPTFGGKYKRDDFGKGTDKDRKEFFIKHCKDTLKELYNYPSILCYTIFNEGWGQFEADKLYDVLTKEDPTRLYDSTSGWFHQKKSDFDSRHVYFKNKGLHVIDKPLFLSECGGFSYVVEGHVSEGTSYGYGACPNENALTYKICEMYEEMVYPVIEEGMCGCIYTQLSDVENEINGLYTYDRKRRKVIRKKMLEIRKRIDEEINKLL